MKIAVIGAGPAGLVTIKELLADGHDVICFEKADDVGGLFRYDSTGVSVYESTLMTSSSYISCFSDFPPPDQAPMFFRQTEYFDYLKRYADHFQLRKCIQFKQEVKDVYRRDDGKWIVKVFSQLSKLASEDIFDAVAVCSGVHQTPMIPPIPHMEKFKGDIRHSALYKNPRIYQDKSVVIVGAGESASDITREVSKVTKSCFLSLRRGAYIIPRFVFQYPNDHFTDRILYAPPMWFLRLSKSVEEILWLRVVLLLLSLPFFILFIYMTALVLVMICKGYVWLFTRYAVVTIIGTILLAFWINSKIQKFTKQLLSSGTYQVMDELRKKSGAAQAEQFSTKSEGLAVAISEGRCSLKPEIAELTEDSVKFKDGSSVQADGVLFCTGFKTEIPFLKNAETDLRKYYKHCFNPELGASICFIGFIRPGIGAVPPMAEMQARWFARVLSGDCRLPDKEAMVRNIQEDNQCHRKKFHVVTDRMSWIQDFTSYMDELASWIGCKPKFSLLIHNPFLLWRVYTSPFAGYQFRLFGPHANKEVAIRAIMRSPKVYIKSIGHIFTLIPFVISWILYKMNFKIFKPHLTPD